MTDTLSNVIPHKGILSKTLGEILQENKEAQGVVMHGMQINPQQLQEMLQAAGDNQMMHMTIGDLFKNGVMQQAMIQSKQVSPKQMQQILGMVNGEQASGQPVQQNQSEQIFQEAQVVPKEEKVHYTLPKQPQKQSFFQKLKKFFI